MAEVVTPLTKSAVDTAKRAKSLLTRFGEHQDVLTAAALLEEQGRAVDARANHNGFSEA